MAEKRGYLAVAEPKKTIQLQVVGPSVMELPFPRRLKQGELRKFCHYLAQTTPATVKFIPELETTYSPPIDLGQRVKRITNEELRRRRVSITTTIGVKGTIYTNGSDMLMYKFMERAPTKKNARMAAVRGTEFQPGEYFGLELHAQNDLRGFNENEAALLGNMKQSLKNYFQTYR